MCDYFSIHFQPALSSTPLSKSRKEALLRQMERERDMPEQVCSHSSGVNNIIKTRLDFLCSCLVFRNKSVSSNQT